MTINPTFYTLYEGGFWYAWRSGPVAIDDLQQRDRYATYINNNLVHSLLFIKADSGFSGRWDCINGWTL